MQLLGASRICKVKRTPAPLSSHCQPALHRPLSNRLTNCMQINSSRAALKSLGLFVNKDKIILVVVLNSHYAENLYCKAILSKL